MQRENYNKPDLTKIFIRSKVFYFWQKYCKFREGFIFFVKRLININYNNKPISEKEIFNSKTYKTWRFFYNLFQILNRLLFNPLFLFIKKLLPQPFKNKLKGFLGLFKKKDIDSKILKEWKSWELSRKDNSIDIINFGVISYDYRFQRPQHLAANLVKMGNRVFYINVEFINSLKTKKAPVKVVRVDENIYSINLASPVNYFIYKKSPSQKAIEMMFYSLKTLMREAKIINPVAKIDHPFWVALKDKLNMLMVYDYMDLHKGFKESGKLIGQNHLSLTKIADLILVSSDYLKETIRTYEDKTIYIKNAGDYDVFSKISQEKISKPKDLQNIKGSIIGYYGALADWFNTDIIEHVAKKFPNDSIVLIGRIQNQKLLSLAKKYKNIKLLGEKPYKSLINYLAFFNVCIIPFKLTPLIKATDPVKIYEYFASGKPVVATQIPELKHYADLIYFGKTKKQFAMAIGQALKERSANLSKKRRQIAKQNTWQMRAEVLNKKLQELMFPKVSVVILTYNNPKLSKISIDSVINRSKYGNIELIVVDNKSEEKTLKILKSYKEDKKIKLIFNKKNYGFSKGNNIGIRKASGEYIILLNNDVRVTPGWIERLVFHARNPKVGLVGPVTNSIGNESKINIQYDHDNQKEMENKAADYIYSHWGEILKLNNIAAFAWLMSKSTYKKIGDLDEVFGRGLFEDDDYCIRVKKARLEILCAEDAFVHHYGGASTNWGSLEYKQLFEINKDKFEKKWGITWTPHKYRK